MPDRGRTKATSSLMRCGVGSLVLMAREMVEDALARLRAAGVKRVELFVETDNARAIRFYKRLGFEIEGTLRDFYKRASDAHYVDEHIMALLFE